MSSFPLAYEKMLYLSKRGCLMRLAAWNKA